MGEDEVTQRDYYPLVEPVRGSNDPDRESASTRVGGEQLARPLNYMSENDGDDANQPEDSPPYRRSLTDRIGDPLKILGYVAGIVALISIVIASIEVKIDLPILKENLENVNKNTVDIKESLVRVTTSWEFAQREITNIDRKLEKIDENISDIKIEVNKTSSEIGVIRSNYRNLQQQNN